MGVKQKISFFKKMSDDWETPKEVWKDGLQYVPKHLAKKAWDPFFCKGRAKIYLEDLGFEEVHHKQEDFFQTDLPENTSIIVTNPPFSILEKVFERILSFKVPTLMLVPKTILTKEWFMRCLHDNYYWDLRPTAKDYINFIGHKGVVGPAPFTCMWVLLNIEHVKKVKRKR